MWWQLILVMIVIFALVLSVLWFVKRQDEAMRREIDNLVDEIYRDVGVESSYIDPIHDDRYETGSVSPIYDNRGRIIGFVRDNRDG